MFEQDYLNDDEASADERGRSPRGAGSAARFVAERAEHRIDRGHDIFGPSRRGRASRGPFGGEAFGVAPKDRDIDLLDRSSLSGGAPRERVVELRDYSSKAVMRDFSERERTRVGDPMADLERFEQKLGAGTAGPNASSGGKTGEMSAAHEAREAALLSGRTQKATASRGKPAPRELREAACDKDIAKAAKLIGLLGEKGKGRDAESSSTSSSSSKKKKRAKKKDKKEKKKEKKRLKKEQKKSKKKKKNDAAQLNKDADGHSKTRKRDTSDTENS